MKNIFNWILIATIIIFFVCLFFLLAQTFNINSSNLATLINGILGMLGGVLGAFGAYSAANSQMKKQFEKIDRDRVLEIKVQKLVETLDELNQIKHLFSKWYGYTTTIEMGIDKKIGHDTYFLKEEVLVDYLDEKINDCLSEIVHTKDSLKRNKIFYEKIIDVEQLYNQVSDLSEVKERFFRELFDISNTNVVDMDYIIGEFKMITLETSKINSVFNIYLQESINKLEMEINRLLKID